MKKRLLLLLLLLFALFGVIVVVPRILDGTFPQGSSSGESETYMAELPTETMEPDTYPPETVSKAEPTETESMEYGPGMPTEPTEPAYDPGPPVEREKIVTDIMFASDIHYMSTSLTDYGQAFEELVNSGDGKVIRYLPEIWQAFAEEVISARTDALVLSGDLTLNGEKANHQELTSLLAKIEAAGIEVLVIPGNHDINNPYATSYFGESQSFVEPVTADEFYDLYRAYGYDEAASHAPDSLSYLYILNDTTWMLMLDSCIYEPDNEVDGEIKEGTMEWIEQCLREAYSQGITVIPVGHHNLQELSRVYVEECVIRNHQELTDLLELYLTPVYFSGHLHVQRVQKHTNGPGTPETVYGITEVVSNSLIIPPCQYGNLTLNADGTMSYHTKNTDVSSWAAKHGSNNSDLLDFTSFSDNYVHSVISHQIFEELEYIPDELKEQMAEFYADLYKDYYAGRQINYSERKKEIGYLMWNRYMNPSTEFRQVEGMLMDSMVNNNNAEIPNPIYQNWQR